MRRKVARYHGALTILRGVAASGLTCAAGIACCVCGEVACCRSRRRDVAADESCAEAPCYMTHEDLIAYSPQLFDLISKTLGTVLAALIARRLSAPPPALPPAKLPPKKKAKRKTKRLRR